MIFFQFAGIVFSCAPFIGVGFGYVMGWFPILIDIIVGWWIVLLCGGVTVIMLFAIIKVLDRMKNDKMERKTEDYESS